MIVVPVEKRIDWKRPPLVLIALVLMNIAVFIFYQSDDAVKSEQAVEYYTDADLLAIELPAYKDYLRNSDLEDKVDLESEYLIWYIATDTQFSAFIDSERDRYISSFERDKWRAARDRVDKVAATISSNALGLSPSNVGLVTLLSHQFLHADIMHLIGNLVFLVLTGFAVEAALGSKRFFAYYLISGVGAGSLYLIVDALSGGSGRGLIGASGSISGVMALYVVLFSTRKIEFFYWFLVFTGYFRAAAIIMLPAYILKELSMFLLNDGTNVAYTAHIGGFLVGALLVLATRSLNESAIDNQYLDVEGKDVDPYQAALASLYSEISHCEFKKAWQSLKVLKGPYAKRPELKDVEFNLLLALNAKKADEYLNMCIGRRGNTPRIVRAQVEHWQRMKPDARAALSFGQKCGLAEAMLEADYDHLGEEIYAMVESEIESQLGGGMDQQERIAVLARKLAMHFQFKGNDRKEQRYNQCAKQAMKATFDGPTDGSKE